MVHSDFLTASMRYDLSEHVLCGSQRQPTGSSAKRLPIADLLYPEMFEFIRGALNAKSLGWRKYRRLLRHDLRVKFVIREGLHHLACASEIAPDVNARNDYVSRIRKKTQA